MAFKKSFDNHLNKSLNNTVSISETGKSYQPEMQKSMTAYLPSYRPENLYGQSPEAGFEYKLPSSMLRKMYERNVVVRAAIDTIINETLPKIETDNDIKKFYISSINKKGLNELIYGINEILKRGVEEAIDKENL